jgi:hypothetical protein
MSTESSSARFLHRIEMHLANIAHHVEWMPYSERRSFRRAPEHRLTDPMPGQL